LAIIQQRHDPADIAGDRRSGHAARQPHRFPDQPAQRQQARHHQRQFAVAADGEDVGGDGSGHHQHREQRGGSADAPGKGVNGFRGDHDSCLLL